MNKGIAMQDMTLGYVATRSAIAPRELPGLGLAMMLGLALAATIFGVGHPASVIAEYAMAATTADEG
jgi:hypothetical protein